MQETCNRLAGDCRGAAIGLKKCVQEGYCRTFWTSSRQDGVDRDYTHVCLPHCIHRGAGAGVRPAALFLFKTAQVPRSNIFFVKISRLN